MSWKNRKRSIDVANLSNVSEADLSDDTTNECSAGKRIMLEFSMEKENSKNVTGNSFIPLAIPEPDSSDNEVKPTSAVKEEKPNLKQRKSSRLRRSISVPNLLDEIQKGIVTQRRATTTLVPPLEDKDASLSNWDSFDTTKLHELTNIRISKPFSHKECSVCNTNIKFGTTCCKCSVCRLTFHVNCIQSIPIPCLPRKETPKSISNKGRLRLGDFCPDVRPMIPHLLGHCTVYLERSEIPCDLYSSFGDEDAATNLLSYFKRNKAIPRLTDFDCGTIAGCVKKFLLEIRDSLIPSADGRDFVNAALKDDDLQTLLQLINGLSIAHRDTLIYMVRHWKSLGELSYNGSIRMDKLCLSMGPVVLGVNRAASQIKEEEAARCLEKILSIPAELINNLLEKEQSASLLRKSSQQSNDFIRFQSSSNLPN